MKWFIEAVVRRCSVKKEISQNSLFNKVAGLRPATLLKKSFWHRCFPVNFPKFLRTPFFTEHLQWLLLDLWAKANNYSYWVQPCQNSFVHLKVLYQDVLVESREPQVYAPNINFSALLTFMTLLILILVEKLFNSSKFMSINQSSRSSEQNA